MHERKQRSAVRFGPFVLDFEAGLLLRAGEPVHLRRKSHVLLAFLAGNAGRVVSKDELLAAVWPGVHVTEDSLTQSVHEIRKALGGGEQFLRTVSGRGYVLVADPVRPPRRSALLLFDGFTVADDADAALAARLSDTIRAMLTKFAQLSVRSGPAPPRETEGIYRLEGRICVAGDIPVLQIDLTDAETAATLWSHKTEGAPEADRDEACNRIVCRLLGRINDAELQRVARKATDDLDARDLTLRGQAWLQGYRNEDNLEASRCLEAAIAADADYGPAHSLLAISRLMVAGTSSADTATIADCIVRASLGVTLAAEDPRAHRALGIVRLFARQHEAAEAHMRRSLALNPYDADTVVQLGFVLTMRGRLPEALELSDRAFAINPIHPDYYHYDRAMTLYAAGRYRESIAALDRLPIGGPARWTRAAAAYAQLGESEEARRHIALALTAAPGFSPIDFATVGVPFEREPDRQRLVEGVRKALEA